MKQPNLKLKKPDSDIKAPKLVRDVYADLKDRRLLPLVALLLVAILATPFLLKSEDKESPTAVVPTVKPGGGSPASFSVVPADPGLREVDKRLGYRKSRDPFRVPEEVRGVIPQEATGAGSPEGGGSLVEAPPPAEGSSPVGGTAPVEEGGGGTVVTETTAKVVVEADVTDWGAHIKAGFVGGIETEHEFVPQMTVLPNKKRPIVTFVGLSEDRTGAVFLMSSDVTAYYGKGSCVGNPRSCQLLELQPGRQATFAVGFGETRYKLALEAIVPKVRSITEEVGGGE